MRLRSALKWMVSLGVVVYLVAPAGAQTSGASRGSDEPAARVGFERKTQLTPQEQLEEAGRRIARMETQASALRKQLQAARQARDVVKTLCLNDKLSQIDVAGRAAAERAQSLKGAVARNDSEAANHEYTVLAVLGQRAEQLGSEASQCIGEESTFVGDTTVKTSIDPSVAPESGDYPDFPGGFPPGPPPSISPTGDQGVIR